MDYIGLGLATYVIFIVEDIVIFRMLMATAPILGMRIGRFSEGAALT